MDSFQEHLDSHLTIFFATSGTKWNCQNNDFIQKSPILPLSDQIIFIVYNALYNNQ